MGIIRFLKNQLSAKERFKIEKNREDKREKRWTKGYKKRYLKKHGKVPTELEVMEYVYKRGKIFNILTITILIVALIYKVFDLIKKF